MSKNENKEMNEYESKVAMTKIWMKIITVVCFFVCMTIIAVKFIK